MNNCKIPTIEYKDFAEHFQDKMQRKGKSAHGQWEITFRCNLRCVHCYAAEDHAKKELTFSEITNILDQIHQEGCLWLCLTGGEPLLRHDFLDIYTYAIKKGFLVTLFTNGTLITPEIADHLQEYPPFMIDITLHSLNPEIFEKITEVPGSFKSCMQGISLILERNLPLTLKSVGMRLNYKEILKIKEYVEGLGKVKFRYDSIIIPKLDGSKEPCQLRLTPEEIIGIEYKDENMCEEWKMCFQSDHENGHGDNLFRCGGGTSLFNISPYGELQLCHLLRRPSFNLRQGSFKEGVSSLFPGILSAQYKTNSRCKDCKISHLCPQCPAKAELENDDPEVAIEYFCELAHKREEKRGILIPES